MGGGGAESSFLYFLWQNLPSVLYLFVCNLITLIHWNVIAHLNEPIWFFEKMCKSFFTTILLEIILLGLIFLFVPKRFSKYALIALCLMSAILFVVEEFLLQTFFSTFTPYILSAIMQTNPQEAKEFFISFINLKILGLACGFILLSLAYFKLFTIHPKRFHIGTKWTRIIAITLCLVGIIFIGDIVNKAYRNKSDYLAKLNQNSLTRIAYSLIQYYGGSGFYTDLQQLIANYQALRESYQGKVSKSADSPKHIVLVIGESAQRNLLSAYGYSLPNTPYLNTLINNGGGGQIVLFSDTIAPHSATQFTLQHLLNFSNTEDKEWFNSLDIINLFSLAGYNTSVFSAQSVAGNMLHSFGAIASFANHQDHLNKFMTYGENFKSRHDGNLLPFIQSAFEQNQAEFSFDVIHLVGQHFSYEHRYPQEFAKFKSSDIHYPSYVTEEQKEVIARYHNALLYGDYVLSEIFKVYQATDAIVIYVSDHGESMYDKKGERGHAFASRFTAEIPLIVMMTEEFIKNHKETAQKIQAAKDKPFMSDDLIHMLVDIAQINVQDYDATKNPLSDKFNDKRVRIFDGKVDYDKELKGESATRN